MRRWQRPVRRRAAPGVPTRIVVSGPMAAGKVTLMRAAMRDLPATGKPIIKIGGRRR